MKRRACSSIVLSGKIFFFFFFLYVVEEDGGGVPAARQYIIPVTTPGTQKKDAYLGAIRRMVAEGVQKATRAGGEIGGERPLGVG